MVVSEATIEEIASVFNTIPPDELLVLTWIGALKSGDYKFGYGLLRSGDDEYDAFGVLAAITVVDWTWAEGEDAWAVDGAVYAPRDAQVRAWLGIPETAGTSSNTYVNILIDRIGEIGDSATSLASVAQVLEKAWTHAQAAKTRFQQARYALVKDRMIGSVEDRYALSTDIRPYFARV